MMVVLQGAWTWLLMWILAMGGMAASAHAGVALVEEGTVGEADACLNPPGLAPSRGLEQLQNPSPRPRLSGVVIDDAGMPVEGARIRWAEEQDESCPETAVSGADGRFQIDRPGVGRVLMGEASGHLEFRLVTNIHSRRHLIMEAPRATSFHVVVTNPSGEPVRGAACIVTASGNAESMALLESTTDEHGVATLGRVARGAVYDVGVRKAGFAPVSTTLVATEAVHELGLRLKPGAGIAGAVILETGAVATRVQAVPRFDDPSALRFWSPPPPTDGQFTLTDLPAGRFRLEVTADGAVPQVLPPVRMLPGKNAQLEPTTLALSSTVTVTLRDVRGEPVTGAEVTVEGFVDGRADTRELSVDSAGGFVIDGLKQGESVRCHVQSKGHAGRTERFTAPGVHEVVLQDDLTVHLDVGPEAEGMTAEEIGVWVMPETERYWGHRLDVTHSESGELVVGGLVPGTFVARVEMPGLAPGLSESFTLEQGREAPVVNVELGEGYVLTGEVRAEGSESPVRGAEVTVQLAAGTVRSSTTDSSGRFEFEGLDTPVKLTVRHSDYRRAVEKAVQLERADKHLTVELSSGCRLTGSVVKDGAPRVGAVISAAGQMTTVDFEGRYELGGLPCNPTLVRMQAPRAGPEEAVDKLAQLSPSAENVLDFGDENSVEGRVMVGTTAASHASVGLVGRGAPLFGAPTWMATADGSGFFELPDLPDGEFVVTIGWQGARTSMTKTIHAEAPGELVIQVAAARLQGQVIDAGIGAPVPFAAVEAVATGEAGCGTVFRGAGGREGHVPRPVSSCVGAATTADAHGRYSLNVGAIGAYVLRAKQDGYRSVEGHDGARIDLGAGENAWSEIALQRVLDLSVEVRSATGALVPDAVIALLAPFIVQTARSGAVTFSNLVVAEGLSIIVGAPGYAPTLVAASVRSADNAPFIVTPRSGGSVVVRTRDGGVSLTPLGFRGLKVWTSDGLELTGSLSMVLRVNAQALEDGGLLLSQVPVGTIRIGIDADGDGVAEAERFADVLQGQTTEVVF